MLKKVQDILLCLSVFSLGFELWDPVGLVGIISISKIIFILYLCSILCNGKQMLKIRFNSKLILAILLWLLLVVLSSLIYSFNNPNITDNTDSSFARTIQCIIIFIVIANHLIIRGKKLLFRLLIYIALIPIFQIIVVFFGSHITSTPDGRLLFLGDNPNNIGIIAAISAVISFVLMYNNIFTSKKRFLLYFALFASFNIVMLTQSRGAIIAIAIGLVTQILVTNHSIRRKVLLIIITGSISAIGYYQLKQNLAFKERLDSLIQEGDNSRVIIYDDISDFIYDIPIWGIGENGYYNEITKIRGSYKATHNGFLDVYITTGIIGLLIFLYFIIKIGVMAYRDARYNNMVIPITLYFMILFNFSKSGGGWTHKMLWIILSIAVASYYIDQNNNKKTICN